MAAVPLDVVKKYSPVFQFHENEPYLPCSIEHLLENSTLHYRNIGFRNPIPGQSSTDAPSIVAFKGWLYMVYQEVRNYQFFISRSLDGLGWHDTQKIAGVAGGGPTLVVFQDQLWMVWHGALSHQLWIASSIDGFKWDGIQKIAGHEGWNTSLAVYDNSLFMVYTDSGSSQLWMSQSANGQDWHTVKITGQHGTFPSITTFRNKVVMVYVSPRVESNRISVSCFSQNHWTPPHEIVGLQAFAPALTSVKDCLFMMYTQPDDLRQLWATRSFDPTGVEWKDTQQVPHQYGRFPDMTVLNDTVFIIYRDGTQLVSTFCEHGNLTPHPPIHNPTQETLQSHPDESYYVSINPSQFRGQPIPSAPMYYAIQQRDDTVTIHYLILYAYQGGQTVRALRVGSEFDCIISTIGVHQGDLERFTITLKPLDTDYTIVNVGFEAHGRLEIFPPTQVKWEDNTHAIVHPALNGHACRNRNPTAGPIIEFQAPGLVAVGGWPGSGAWWRPSSDGSDFKRLGLDDAGNPISEEVWSAFRGRLGDTKANSLVHATNFDGTDLSPYNWAFVRLVFTGGNLLSLIPPNLMIGDAPFGPGRRDWVSN